MNTLKLNPWTGLLLPVLLFLAATPWLSELDLSLSRFFYREGLFSQDDFWQAVYRYGIIPAWLTVGGALVGLALSFYPSKQRWRLPCLYLILTLAIGSGLIVHAGLKEHWHRPRPRQIEEFGGAEPFRPFYQPNMTNSSKPLKSFSSGHSTMGFYFFSVAILGAVLQNAMLYWGGMSAAWVLGGLLSLARIAQGGHFLSDVLASALIMWLVAWSLAYLFFIYASAFTTGLIMMVSKCLNLPFSPLATAGIAIGSIALPISVLLIAAAISNAIEKKNRAKRRFVSSD